MTETISSSRNNNKKTTIETVAGMVFPPILIFHAFMQLTACYCVHYSIPLEHILVHQKLKQRHETEITNHKFLHQKNGLDLCEQNAPVFLTRSLS
jgi:hypothetical protein